MSKKITSGGDVSHSFLIIKVTFQAEKRIGCSLAHIKKKERIDELIQKG